MHWKFHSRYIFSFPLFLLNEVTRYKVNLTSMFLKHNDFKSILEKGVRVLYIYFG